MKVRDDGTLTLCVDSVNPILLCNPTVCDWLMVDFNGTGESGAGWLFVSSEKNKGKSFVCQVGRQGQKETHGIRY